MWNRKSPGLGQIEDFLIDSAFNVSKRGLIRPSSFFQLSLVWAFDLTHSWLLGRLVGLPSSQSHHDVRLLSR
jgi:hypothetical protein